ncbi:sensor histidine kinase [Kineosporia succinea]|uniref:Sensor histidine kinase regulating citrate/malate metabolism n=1 Tax=Kineosporia succinea TaxID=84632 RepID=A0ABT9P287_9ACTN|nr:sensor histidine kinase [Kineosporia succinea]MDP9826529.1 sensor histidine kinase regulating citrate/malate metabolism [Kineosporia succinea]
MDPRHWSVARQAFGLVVAAVVLLVGSTVVAAYIQTHDQVRDATAHEMLALAQTISIEPSVHAALETDDPSARLQPYTERLRQATNTDFITVMTPGGIRYTHTNASLIGKQFLGHTDQARAGHAFTETYTGTLGPSVRAVAPIEDASGRVIALVAVGVTIDNVGELTKEQLPPLFIAGAVVLLAGAGTAYGLGRRLERQTLGMGQAELTRMFEFYEGVLHAVREGLLIIDPAGRVQLMNDEAMRLLGLSASVIGQRLADLPLPAGLMEALQRGGTQVDELQLTREGVLVVSQSPARWNGRVLGSVVTLRDHTDLVALSDELSQTKSLTESLRSQAHESANRLHSVITMIELGETDRALEFATSELAGVQELTDRVISQAQEPVVAALLLGKAAEAAERGIRLEFPGDLEVPDGVLPSRDLLTVLGNLIDNAFEATLTGAPEERRVSVEAYVHSTAVPLALRPGEVPPASGSDSGGPGTPGGSELRLRVGNSGPPVADPELIFERGWSTKQVDASGAKFGLNGTAVKTGSGRGLGLALVRQSVERNHGTIALHRDESLSETVFEVRFPL